MKTCRACQVVKGFSEFSPDAAKSGGFSHQCKACKRKASAERYATKREEILVKKSEYRAANRHLARQQTAAWAAANPLVRQANRARYRARKRGAEGSYTAHDIQALKVLQRNRCAVCAVSLKAGFDVDHFYPLALGGSNDRLNLQLLCPPCNQSKGAKDPLVFANQRGRLF